MKTVPRSPLCTIYRITNRVNGKVYIGQTWTTLEHRWKGHLRHPHCRKLFRAIAVYGADSFAREVVTFASTQAVADTLEARLIEAHGAIRSGYNIRGGGAAGKLSEETRAKMRAAHLGKVISESQREKARAANLGKKRLPRSAEWCARIGNAHRGKTASADLRERMSLERKGRQHSPETRARMSATRKALAALAHDSGKPYVSPEARAKIQATLMARSAEERRAAALKAWDTRRSRAKEIAQ